MSKGLLFALLLVPLASGCAKTAEAVTRPSEMYTLNPGEKADGYAISYDSRGRGAYLVKAETVTDQGNTKKRTGLVFCAEPPPDASANLTANREVNAAVEAMVKLKAVEVAAKGSGGSKDSASSEIANVATRTELVLLMRDALYRICEMNANGVLSDEKAEEVFRNVLSTARTLGQRDNVGKLIDVLAIVAAAEADRPKLVESLVSTIRLIALGDQLIQTDQGASGIATALTLQMMLSEIGSISDAEIKKILATALVQQIEKLTKQRSKTNVKEIDRSIEALKSLGMSMGLEPEALKVQ